MWKYYFKKVKLVFYSLSKEILSPFLYMALIFMHLTPVYQHNNAPDIYGIVKGFQYRQTLKKDLAHAFRF